MELTLRFTIYLVTPSFSFGFVITTEKRGDVKNVIITSMYALTIIVEEKDMKFTPTIPFQTTFRLTEQLSRVY